MTLFSANETKTTSCFSQQCRCMGLPTVSFHRKTRDVLVLRSFVIIHGSMGAKTREKIVRSLAMTGEKR